jgi:hypothetical protein
MAGEDCGRVLASYSDLGFTMQRFAHTTNDLQLDIL